MLLHLLALDDWLRSRAARFLTPGSLAAEGFVHCSADDTTMLAVANRFYSSGGAELVVLSLDEGALTSEVRWEPPAHPDGRPARDGEPRFPHVYGPLDLGAVRAVRPLRRDATGRFVGFGEPLP